MRKKTVNHVADTVFWYVLYFLPIISYLLFCFTEPVKIEQLDTSSTVSVVSTADLSTADSFVLPMGEYTFNDTLDFSMLTAGAIVDIYVDFTCVGFQHMKINIYVGDGVMQYDSSMVYHNGFKGDYKVINVLADTVLDNQAYLAFFDTNTNFVAPPTPPTPIEPTLSVVPFYDYMISTYKFIDGNFIYNTITSVFGENGVFNLALDNGIYLYFSWFIGVYLMHLFVDFILFIPRLCHKWLKQFTQGD